MYVRTHVCSCGQLKLKSLSRENSSASAQGLNTSSSSNSSSEEGFIAFIQQYLAMLWLYLTPTSEWKKTAQETKGTIRSLSLAYCSRYLQPSISISDLEN